MTDTDSNGNYINIYLGGSNLSGVFTFDLRTCLPTVNNKLLKQIILYTNGFGAEILWQSLRFKNSSGVYAPMPVPAG